MKRKIMKAFCFVTALAILLAFPVKASATAQGTNGTELNILQAQKIEIQLGPDWSGVEFELKTDAGKYPGTIPVGQDGILRFEVGGSERYILTCLNSQAKPPVQETAENTLPEEVAVMDALQTPELEQTSDSSISSTSSVESPADSGSIPIWQVILFVVGLVIAIGILIYVVSSQKRNENAGHQDDNDFF